MKISVGAGQTEKPGILGLIAGWVRKLVTPAS